MSPEKYLELYKKYIGGGLNLDGIILTPISINGEYDITFHLSNPEDKSYSEPAIRGWVNENRFKFLEILGVSRDYMPSYLDIEKLYFSKTLIKQLTQYFKSVKVVKIGAWSIYVKHLYFTAGIRRDESLVVTNYVEPYKCVVTTQEGKVYDVPLKEGLEHYKHWQRDSKYDETELNYPNFDEIIDSEGDVLVDGDWMVQYVVTEFDLNP